MQHPRISVVLPVHNGACYLVSAVESILEQSFPDFELIVINDGSTDGSLATLQMYAASDERVVLVSREQRGLIETLNEGIRMARAPFIARMDADDIAFPERLARQFRFLQENPSYVAVGSAAIVIDSAGDATGEISVKTRHEEIDRCNMLGAPFGIPHPTAMIRREPLLELGGYRKEFPVAEDVDLFLRLAERGKLANLSGTFLAYRIHGDNVSQRRRAVQTASAEAAILDAYRRRHQRVPAELCLRLAEWALETERIWHARRWTAAAVFRDRRDRACWHLLALAWFPLTHPQRRSKWLAPARLCCSFSRRVIHFLGEVSSRF